MDYSELFFKMRAGDSTVIRLNQDSVFKDHKPSFIKKTDEVLVIIKFTEILGKQQRDSLMAEQQKMNAMQQAQKEAQQQQKMKDAAKLMPVEDAKIQAYYEAHNADALKNFFTDKMGTTSINSVGMTKIYSLTSKSTASASELVINGLKPYMDVVQIGDTTVGKNVGSVTLYDSPSFGKENRNPNHHYAMQPIVLKIVNADDFGDYFTGLVPTVELKESLSNLDVLGSTTEPLLSTAIGQITGVSRMMKQSPTKEFELFKDSKSITRLQNQMYLDKAPDGLRKAME
jgi:hypothetical protein